MFLEQQILEKIYLIPAILIGLTFHEFAHAFVADKLGDKTPKFQGRLTLNPFVHIDILGFIMIMLIGFGWAKPVQTNPSAYKNYYKDDLKVSIAGPMANLIVAFLGSILVVIFYKLGLLSLAGSGNISLILTSILLEIISINCMLFVFNLIPLPGLDGFHVLRDIFPSFFYKISDSIYRYQLIILLIFVATPIASFVVGVPVGFLYKMFIKFINLMA
ncbi:MAG: site-2 protease family protein [Solirubrobacterales bacterium]